jgi:sugar fermentation stimulation protein A
MIMIGFNGFLEHATFLNRINRFVAEITTTAGTMLCHVPNTGRMQELLFDGARILVRKSLNSKRKTAYDLIAVNTTHGWMAIDSRFPNQLVKYGIINGFFTDFTECLSIREEFQFGNSRFDLLYHNSTDTWLIENKCCTLVENGLAQFPDAPTERGKKHMEELTVAISKGYKTAVFFIVQCRYAVAFKPNEAVDPDFCKSLRKAAAAGTKIYAYNCFVTDTSISLLHQIPVYLR